MAYLIGIDEAGYGPNLGPLVVAGSLWHVGDAGPAADLYARLQPTVAASPCANRLSICDSKKLHEPQASLAPLEENVLPVWMNVPRLAGLPLARCSLNEDGAARLGMELADLLVCAVPFDLDRLANQKSQLPFEWAREEQAEAVRADGWYYLIPEPLRLPIAAHPTVIQTRSAEFGAVLNQSEVSLLDVRFLELTPRQFNYCLASCGSKGSVLTRASLTLVQVLLSQCKSPSSIVIVCDKHGGRNRYLPALASALPDVDWQVLGETSECSAYESSASGEPRIQLRFQARGESFLPTALASMAAKYIREIRMELWNRFWRIYFPEIHPTKGYPADARRFFAEIESALAVMQVSRADVWRAK